MKKFINLFALVLVAVSVIACSNPSDSIGYYPTTVQTAPQGTNKGGQETPSSTVIKFTKAGLYEFYLNCDSIEFPSEGYYVNVIYKGTTYKVENFKYDSNDIQSMSTTGYDKTSQRFYFKFSNISEENAFITNEVSVTRLGIRFNRKFVNQNAYVGIDTSNGTLIINSGN